MTINQDLQELISYLKAEKIFIDFEEFKFQIETHPDYPSLLAFSDALTFFKIPHVATKVEKEYLENLPDFFMALILEEKKGPTLKFFTKVKDNYFYNQKKTHISTEELQKKWMEVVLLVEKPEEFKEPKNKTSFLQGVLIITTIFSTVFLIFLLSQSWSATIYTCITIVGIYFSIEALKTELGIESKISKSFCQIVSNSDCTQVINSKKNNLLKKIKISDISLWFFNSQLFLLLIFSALGDIQSFFNLMMVSFGLSIPFTFYSVYFQYKIEKKWCPICLTIISLIYFQMVLVVMNHSKIIFDVKNIFVFAFGFLLVTIFIYFFKPLLLQLKTMKEKEIKSLRFKKNYSFFKNNLVKNEQQIFENASIVLGNPKASLKISIITSPFCGFCKEAHEVLHHVLSDNYNNIAINIRFNFDEDSSEKSKTLFYRLFEIYISNGDLAFSNALMTYFETKNLDLWFKKYGYHNDDNIEIKGLLLNVSEENKSKSLNFTPNIFINQYKFPEQYDRSDLEYFIMDLIEDTNL